MQFSPDVERWRAIVAKYVPAQYVDKFLWTMNGESGGNPNALGDGGHSVGLMQIQDDTSIPGRPSKGILLDPEENIRYAALSLGAANGNFAAWGDGTAGQAPYDPATGRGRFGALGANPFPGDVAPINGRAPVAGDVVTNLPLPDIPDIPGIPHSIDIPGIGRALATLTPGGSVIYVLGETAYDAAGKVLGPAKDVLDATKQAAATFIKAVSWLLVPQHWFRLFFVAMGATLFLFGGYLYIRGDAAVSDVGKVAAAA